MIDEIVNEWLQRVTAVAMPYPLDSPDYDSWKIRYDKNCAVMKLFAEELREVLKIKLISENRLDQFISYYTFERNYVPKPCKGSHRELVINPVAVREFIIKYVGDTKC